MYLSTFVTCHLMFFLFICIIYVCNVFFKDLLFFCLHPFHVMGWFSYAFALYTFVTFYRVAVFLSHTNRHLLSTSVTCHGMVFLCICIVYVRYTF